MQCPVTKTKALIVLKMHKERDSHKERVYVYRSCTFRSGLSVSTVGASDTAVAPAILCLEGWAEKRAMLRLAHVFCLF